MTKFLLYLLFLTLISCGLKEPKRTSIKGTFILSPEMKDRIIQLGFSPFSGCPPDTLFLFEDNTSISTQFGKGRYRLIETSSSTSIKFERDTINNIGKKAGVYIYVDLPITFNNCIRIQLSKDLGLYYEAPYYDIEKSKKEK